MEKNKQVKGFLDFGRLFSFLKKKERLESRKEEKPSTQGNTATKGEQVNTHTPTKKESV